MDITVTDAQLVEAGVGGQRVWMLATDVVDDDGSTHRRAHVIPEEVLEWRAAEYDIDDPDELLEMVLFEPHLDVEDPLTTPNSIVNADSTEQAREHHRARIAARRGRGRLRDRNPHLAETRVAGPAVRVVTDVVDRSEAPLALLRRELPLDPDRVAVRREHVTRMRDQVRSQAAPGRRGDALPSAEVLRQRLGLDGDRRRRTRDFPE